MWIHLTRLPLTLNKDVAKIKELLNLPGAFARDLGTGQITHLPNLGEELVMISKNQAGELIKTTLPPIENIKEVGVDNDGNRSYMLRLKNSRYKFILKYI